MFDDPQKELQRLEQLLLDEEAERPVEDSHSWDDDLDLDEIRALLDDRDEDMDQTRVYGAVRNYANGYGAPRNRDAADVNLEQYSDRVYDEPREKSNRGLVILAVLETLGIAALPPHPPAGCIWATSLRR